ncbi:MAG: hypothetical protein A2161_00105 [Candidatus Schekmanbacteria bacterium RBG_13_48_7]|uniref:CBM6 domain-containing protein n=1 Tax=Candidatus Schekmanbacteria bacterium RBG_13_48_7 TaxID=1817878 RepID=A0A1F7S236_9BACT|nr:MAG: hypothetical protein A2161_00105 [Candidatus Schekmanbacteria bacterium RBG_13_48_7]
MKQLLFFVIGIFLNLNFCFSVCAQVTYHEEPVSLAIPALVLCTGIENVMPVGETSEFNNDAQRIFVWFQYKKLNAKEKIPISAYWIKDKKTIFESTSWVEENEGIRWFSLEHYSYRNNPGLWHVEILLIDTIILGMDFHIIAPDSPESNKIFPSIETEPDIDVIQTDTIKETVNPASEIEPPESKVKIEISASDYYRGNLKKHHPLYSNLTVSSFEVPSWAEYDLSVPFSGVYELWCLYSSGESRPTKIYFDGLLLVTNGLSETTGGWYKETLKWFKVAETDISQGSHVLRIDNSGNIPCLQSFLFLLKPSDPE